MSLSYKHLLNIRQIALHNVMTNDLDFYIEKAYRFYSSTYHTPLHIAKELIPEAEAVRVFMEHEMEDWSAEDIADLKSSIDDSPKIVLSHAINEIESGEIDNETWIAQQNMLLKKQDEKEKQKKAKEQEDIMKKTHEAVDKLTESLKALNPKDS